MKMSLFTEVQCPAGTPPVQCLDHFLEQAERADRLGYHGIWIAEIHFQPEFSVFSAPYPVLGAVSQRTERLRMGVAVNIPPVHHPLELAEEAATLDVLSHGRMDFAIGRGHPPTRVYEGYGMDREQARGMMEESLQIILGAWTRDVLTFGGRYYRIPEVVVNPKPIQNPHPPIYTAVSSVDGVEYAARLGINIFLPTHTLNRERLKECSVAYWNALRSHGHGETQRDLGLLVPVHIAQNATLAQRNVRTGIMDYYRVIGKTRNEYKEWLEGRGVDTSGLRPPSWTGMTFERVCAEHVVLADPETAVRELRSFAEETGANHLLLWMNMGSIPHPLVLESMERFAHGVKPRLR